MLRYIAKQIAYSSITLLLIITLTFVMMKVVPGDPFHDEKALPTEIHAALRHHYGLDRPLYVQYFQYLYSIATLDLGPSFTYKHLSVNTMIAEGTPVSALLGAEALAIALSGGIFLGALATLYQRRWQDDCILLSSTLLISAPTFLIATFLQYVLAFKLGWFPIARWGSFAQTILPAFALAAIPGAHIARLVRTNLMEVTKQDYFRLAQAKGLSKFKAMIQHGLKNALLPLLPYFAQLAANILTGVFVVEKIFSIPGLGQWYVLSVQNRDYTAIMGITVFYSVVLLFFLVLANVLYRTFYPQMQREVAYGR